MATHNAQLNAQLDAVNFLTDGGMETDFVFNHGVDLPHFASFDLLSTRWGREKLRAYFQQYLHLAQELGVGFILETPTWRANPDWGYKLGYDLEGLRAVNQQAVALMLQLRSDFGGQGPVLISGNIGPRGDGYLAGKQMTMIEAQHYHKHQILTFAGAGVDLISAFTLNYIAEAEGIVLAARDGGLPVVISFTVETDGRLPSGDTLEQAIKHVDAATGAYASYYMINCAHPSHFEAVLGGSSAWKQRIRGIRSNASRCSHAELDACEALDAGNPEEFGQDCRRLQQLLPALRVYGGCCGTDFRHVASVAKACLA